jgi:hypothetical protein
MGGLVVALLAQRDLVFAPTACSVNYPPLCNGRRSPLRIGFTPHGRD